MANLQHDPKTHKNKLVFSPEEQVFIKAVLQGNSVNKSLKKAHLTKYVLRDGRVIDEILGQFGRLGLKWSVLVEKGKKCLEYIIDDPEEKGATKVQAVKIVFWTLLQCNPGLLKEEEELGTRDEAADKVLGPVLPFDGKKMVS